jgi:hypothetical protein
LSIDELRSAKPPPVCLDARWIGPQQRSFDQWSKQATICLASPFLFIVEGVVNLICGVGIFF